MMERRLVAAPLRQVGTDGRTFEGRAAPYNSKTYIGPDKRGFFEQIDPEAFRADLQSGKDIVALFNHNPDYILGRTSAGTLALDSRDDGLYARIQLPGTSWGNDTFESTRRGDIRGMSFGFECRSDDWGLVPGGHSQLRTLRDVNLIDVSPVTMPAYLDTTAAVRSALSYRAAMAQLSYNDKQSLLQGALSRKLNVGSDSWLYVVDMGDDWVVYQVDTDNYMRVSYSLDDTGIPTFGSPEPVNRETSFVPARSRSFRAAGLGGGDALANLPNNSDGTGAQVCPNCQASNGADATYCDQCGTKLTADDPTGTGAIYAVDRSAFILRSRLMGIKYQDAAAEYDRLFPAVSTVNEPGSIQS